MQRLAFLTLFLAGLFAVVGIGGASADTAPVQHGISFTKGCASPTAVGSPYSCSYTIRNNVDEAQDTLTVSGLADTVHSAGGDVSSGNVFGSLKLVAGGGAPTCPGATGTGTAGDPWRAPGLTTCTMPFGSRIDTQAFSFYTVAAADFGLPGHVLTDSAELHWNDLCDGLAAGPPPGGGDCNPNPPDVGSGSQTLVTQPASSTTTAIHNAAHGVVTTVEAGSTVHDFVTVTGQAGLPVPSGNVLLDWFTNSACTGTPAVSSGSVGPLDAAGHFDATGFAQGPLAAGFYGFRAHYAGDATYTGSDGPCEPLRVVDANIQINPPTATNPVGTTHTLTGHVNVNDGTGFVNAPDGTVISFTLSNAGGATATFVGPSSCTTGGGTGSCTAVISSPTAGTTTINDSTDVAVVGLTLHRTSGDGKAGDSASATKLWQVAATAAPLTPGYWKNHQAQTTALLPITLGNYNVNTFAKATAVFGDMNCKDATGCLAGHLLAAKLNVANGSSTCIASTIANADVFLEGQTVAGVTGVVYVGPAGTCNLSTAQRALAIQLKDALDNYNNGTGC